MDEEGLFKNLPNEILRKILEYDGTLNLRCASPSLEKRVTSLMRSKCNTFHIPPISDINCVDIRDTLTIAMAKEQAPESLELWFYIHLDTSSCNIQLHPVKKEILLDFKDKVKLLHISVKDNVELLLELTTVFESLESLFLYNIEDDVSVAACEAMLNKHAHNLKYLHIYNLTRNINVPALPKIDRLSLSDVHDEEAAWTLYEQSRDTISRLDVDNSRLSPPLLKDVSYSYKIKNLKNLLLDYSYRSKFVILNAETISALNFSDVVIDIGWNIELPEFPMLRELSIIYDSNLPTILPKCKATLECLILRNAFYETYTLEMPRLTDLYLSAPNSELLNKMCRSNDKSLEFLCLDLDGRDVSNLYIANLDDTMRMERIVKVVVKGDFGIDNLDMYRNKMARICPNAEVFILKDKKQFIQHIKSRVKRKGFTIDLTQFINKYQEWFGDFN